MARDREARPSSRREFVFGAGAGLGALAAGVAAMDPRVARASNVSQELGHVINVADFGIMGDGLTDQTSVLQRLLEQVALGAGGSILFPPGRYRLGESVTFPANVTLLLPRGALLDNEDDVVIEGTLCAGLYRIFLGSRVRFGPGSVDWSFPQWWGARGDGENDDTAALQAALATRRVFLPAGKYRTTRELMLRNRTTLVGVGNSWNPTATTDSWIQYDGPVGEHVSVLRASTAPVGTEPTSALSNIHIENVVLNGGNAAGYGLYSVYCTNDSSFSDITVRHCLQHGMFIANQWYSSYRNIVARNNRGCGITIGAIFDGWRDTGVNGVLFSNIRASSNGSDARFDEASNLRWGYGVLFRPNAGTDIHQVVSENNFGPGLIFDLGSGCANRVSGGYLEGNGRRARAAGAATRAWGMVVIGHSNARANTVESVYLNGAVGSSDAQSIWLTGRQPTGELTLRDLSFGHHLQADWSSYRFEGHIYWGLSNHIGGHIPSSPAPVDEGLDTLYVAEDGSDDADGRSGERPFRTLATALLMARRALGVLTISCAGKTRVGAILDLVDFPMDRELTISGGGTACLSCDQPEVDEIRVRHALNRVTIRDFRQVHPLSVSACRDVNILHTTISKRGDGMPSVVVAGNSNVAFSGCSTGIDSDRGAPLEERDVRRSPGCMVSISASDA